MTNPNDPAMVTFQECLDGNYRVHEQKTGLTKREYFAGMAMAGIAAANQEKVVGWAAARAVRLADALIEELNKKGAV